MTHIGDEFSFLGINPSADQIKLAVLVEKMSDFISRLDGDTVDSAFVVGLSNKNALDKIKHAIELVDDLQ